MICWLTWLCWLVCVLGLPVSALAADRPVVKMGFYLPTIRDANQADLKVSLQVWAEELAKPLGYQVQTQTYEDMDSLRVAMNRGELHLVNAAGMELAEAFGPEDLQGGYAKRSKNAQEGIVMLVSNKSDIRSFSGLRGKRVSYLIKDRLSEVFLETQCLKAIGQNCRDFLVLSGEKRDIQSVYSVFFGKTDAALTSYATMHTAVQLNPQVAQHLRVILDWKTTALIFGMATRHAGPDILDTMFNSTQETFKSARGRQMLELFKTDLLDKVDASALNPFRDLLQEYRALEKVRRVNKK